MDDSISRQAAIDAIGEKSDEIFKTKQKGATYPHDDFFQGMAYAENVVKQLPSAQSEQRYTEEELRVFAHGISLSLLSKRSAQHWRYDKDTATEIEFLERLYEKVRADMRGEQDG